MIDAMVTAMANAMVNAMIDAMANVDHLLRCASRVTIAT
jgi:hypothetical protein